MPPTVTTPDALDVASRAAVVALIDRVATEDGRDPLSDQALTRLGSTAARHALAVAGDDVVGYAQLDAGSLELVAEPEAIGPLLDSFADEPVLIWSHGRRSRLADALEHRGFAVVRELHQLRRALGPIDPPPAPAGIDIRPFVPGRDEQAWLAVNSAAFANHPEQGAWTQVDLEAREHEAWFDPSGFLMAWRGAELAGFHWTKIHPDGAGEVYVIAVAPAAQGSGLGAVLLAQGLAHLHRRGCTEVLLYVDGDNTGAMRLYERNGFERHDLDLQWASEPAADQSSSGTVSNT